ncbi:MAG: hypothetical protein P8189_11490 [Anaerolineae bacterium]|jgi:dipeptidyl aminopeptidase/acylaminoacyl peptidase
MKREETFWQGLVLFLVFLSTVGVYAVLGWLLLQLRQGGPGTDSVQLSQPGYVVQIVEPLNGAVLQRSASIAIRSALVEPGFVRAEFQVDERTVAVEVNPDPQAAPWMVQWVWAEAGEGSHVLAVQASRAEGGVERSLPVTVTVVPSGKLVFSSNREGAYAIYAMQTGGGGLERLTGSPGDAHQPAPRRDGGLAFVAETTTGQAMIRQLGDYEEQGTDLFAGVDPAWAPEGLSLAFAANVDGASQVFVAQEGDGITLQVTREEVYGAQPTWSPDGEHLAYVAERDGNWDIWIVALDGSEPQRLTADPAMDWTPAWSPSGERLAFVSNRGGSHQIYTIRADGTDVRLLSDFPLGAESPSWSPDGSWLALVAYTGEGNGINAREIHLMRSDGQYLVRLTYDSFDDTEVRWAWIP